MAVVSAVTGDDGHGRECFGDVGARPLGLGVRRWPAANVRYAKGANGHSLLREQTVGWGIGATRKAAPPDIRESARAAAALELALQLIANRWKPSIVLHLVQGPRRRRDLEQRLPRHVSAKVLTEQLRALESDGLVYRVDHTPAGHGRHVTYALTDLGRTLGPAVAAMAAWAVEHWADLARGRRDEFRARDDNS